MDKIGCFGSVLYHDAKSKRCGACPLLDQCATEVASNETKLRDWFNGLKDQAKTTRSSKRMAARGVAPISAPTVEPRVAVSVTTTQPLTASGKILPKKPKGFVDSWCKKGIKFDAYKAGVNPFTNCGNKFAAVAMDLFMAKGEVTKDDLINEFVAKFGWLLGTASSHANITFDTFDYLGIISVHGSKGYLIKGT